jgi:hypothetical protein
MKRKLLNFGFALALPVAVCAPQVCKAQTTNGRGNSASAISQRRTSDRGTAEVSPFRVFDCENEASSVSDYSEAPDAAVPLGMTMADFTGDTHPDRATMNLARFDSSGAQYLIDIELTEGGRQSLSLRAPPVGLFISARDVTGDGTLDLVIRTEWSGTPVAVFLNDGCGRFFGAKTASLAPSDKHRISSSRFEANQSNSTVFALDQRSYQIAAHGTAARRPLVRRTVALSRESRLLAKLFQRSSSDRAPPTVV